MSVHQCTRCPLRFATRAGLTDHLEHDHAFPAGALDPLRYPVAGSAAPLYRSFADDVHTVLLLANQTIEQPMLERTVGQLRAVHPDLAVVVVVPATPSQHLVSGPGGGMPAGADQGLEARSDRAGIAQARWRLRTALGALADLGVPAHGSVGDPNPVTAAARVIARTAVDEIVVSTLDPQMSRWLRNDLPATLERRFRLPVTLLSAQPAG